MIRVVAIVVLLMTPLAVLAQNDAPPPDSVTAVVFEAGLLDGTEVPSTLRYRFEMSGSAIEPPFVSAATMMIEPGEEDGQKAVSFDMFEGPNRRTFGPITAGRQNPMILVFLQRDVTQMGNLTGGAPGYFQRGLRQGFNAPGRSERIEVMLGDRPIEVEKITIKPFLNDPQIGRFPQFRDKVYAFYVGDAVPGGLYRIETVTPDTQSGEVILAESFTFESIEPGSGTP